MSVSGLIGCTQRVSHVQKEHLITSTNTVIQIHETNTDQLSTTKSTIKSSPKKILSPKTKPTAKSIKQIRPIVNSVIDKKESAYNYPKPEELLGMGSLSVNNLLGIPSLLRREEPAQVWQYITENCVLNIYLYKGSISPQSFEVTYYEFHQTESAQNSDEFCFSEIVRNSLTTQNKIPHT